MNACVELICGVDEAGRGHTPDGVVDRRFEARGLEIEHDMALLKGASELLHFWFS